MQLDQASTAVTDQQRLEGTIAAKRGEIICVQQRRSRWMYLAVQRDNDTSHGGEF